MIEPHKNRDERLNRSINGGARSKLLDHPEHHRHMVNCRFSLAMWRSCHPDATLMGANRGADARMLAEEGIHEIWRFAPHSPRLGHSTSCLGRGGFGMMPWLVSLSAAGGTKWPIATCCLSFLFP